jgi:AraC family transcriptional regulator
MQTTSQRFLRRSFRKQRSQSDPPEAPECLEGSSINDPAYAETLGLLLLREVRQTVDLKHSRLNPVRGGLTIRQLRQVKDFIDAQISNRITISDLAAVAGLSQYHFIKAFKGTVGLQPYQYVLSERIRRARGLLSEPDLSLGDEALAVGFSDAAQLNRVFRKFVGVTPTAYRRETVSLAFSLRQP